MDRWRLLLAGGFLAWAIDDLLVVFAPQWTQHTVWSAGFYGALGITQLVRYYKANDPGSEDFIEQMRRRT